MSLGYSYMSYAGSSVLFYHVYYSSIVVSSGSISVNADSSVQLLAEEACTIEDIDVQVCQCMYMVMDAITHTTLMLCHTV